jgi:hypothetical protein
MADYQYKIDVDTDQELSDWELEELRQVVLDWLTPDETTEVTIS